MSRLKANVALSALPVMTGKYFAYREASWVSWGIRLILVTFAAGLVYLVMYSSAEIHVLASLACLFGAASLLLAAYAMPGSDTSALFVCGPEGIYFPERKFFSQFPASWLLVPWRNILDYRVQLLLDETSSRGVVIALFATSEEERIYFASHKVYGVANSGRSDDLRVIQVGYTTFLPRPTNVLAELRRLDTLQRATDPGDEHSFVVLPEIQP